jgi:arsenite methyltransferase
MTTPSPDQMSAEEAKACCAAAYGSDLAALLLGDSYHPGGLSLTRHLAARLGLAPGSAVLDVATGPGATALLLAREYELRVTGVDLSDANVALARGAADAVGLCDQATFELGDAERLPCPDASFDAVVVECALCTFPDKGAAAAEIARVLRPGGTLGLTDVVAEPNRLPDELKNVTARITCVAEAMPLAGYAGLLADVGLRTVHTERHDAALVRMIDQIEARLTLVRLTARERAEALGIDLGRAAPTLDAARTAVAAGDLGYGLLIAEKP